MDAIAEAVKKCMDEADLEETGLRKAAYAAHTKGEKMFSFKGKTYPVKVQGEEVSYGEAVQEETKNGKDWDARNKELKDTKREFRSEILAQKAAKKAETQKEETELEESSCEDEVKKHEKRLHGKDGEVSKHVDKMHKEELSPKQKKIAKLEHPKDKIDAGDLAKLRGEETELDEAEKVATSTGMKVYGSSYGDSAKARRDQVKKDIDTIKGPTTKQLVGVEKEKVKKEEFFKDRLITNYIEEEAIFEEALEEVLSKDATAGDWISDFVHSDNPKFEGKSKKQRQKMALAAYYAKQRNESVDDSHSVTTDTVAGRMPGGMSNTFKQFKVRVSAKDKEAAETKNRIPNSDPMNMTARDPHVGHGGLVSVPPAGVVHKEEVELDEATPPKNTDIADKSYLKDMGKKPTIKSDLKNFKNFLTGKKETNEAKGPTSQDDNVPFEKPYNTTSEPVVTDKSGAKHTPMSRARDLAKSAMNRVKTEMLGKAPGNNG